MSDWDEHIREGVQTYAPDTVLVKFVLIAEVLNIDGEKQLIRLTNEELMDWDRLGMLQYGVIAETHEYGDDDEEDDDYL